VLCPSRLATSILATLLLASSSLVSAHATGRTQPSHPIHQRPSHPTILPVFPTKTTRRAVLRDGAVCLMGCVILKWREIRSITEVPTSFFPAVRALRIDEKQALAPIGLGTRSNARDGVLVSVSPVPTFRLSLRPPFLPSNTSLN
jgi:hypothetical protein